MYTKLIKLSIQNKLKKFVIIISFLFILLGSQSYADNNLDKLKAFGIIDTTIKSEEVVNREKFAKIIIELLGEGNSVGLYKEVVLSDVNKDSEYNEFINAVIQKKMMSSFDNKFRPKENIKMSEAITVVVRTLGYNDSVLQGEWPSNYIIKGVKLDLVNEKMLEDDILSYEELGELLNNALDTKKLEKIINDNSKFVISDELLFSNLDNIKKIESTKIKLIEEKLDKKQLTIEVNGNINDYFINENLKSKIILDIEADIFLNELNEIIFIEYEREPSKGEDSFIINDYDEYPYEKIKLNNDENYYEVDNDSKIYINGEIDKEYDKLGKEIFGTFYFDNKKISYADLLTWDIKDAVVSRIDITKKEIRYYEIYSDYYDTLELEEYSNYEIIINNNGNIISGTINDIQKNDLINVSDEFEDESIKIYIFRNKQNKKIVKLFGGNFKLPLEILFSNEEKNYDLSDTFAYSYNNGDKILASQDRTLSGMNSLLEFHNKNSNIYMNWRNEISYIESKLNVEIDNYGVLVRFSNNIDGKVQIYNKNGKRITYQFEELQEYDRFKENIKEGEIIKYSLSNTKKIRALGNDISENIILTTDISKINSGDNFGSDYVVIEGEKYTVDSDTIIFDYTSHDKYLVEKIDWKNLKEKEVESDVDVIFRNEESNLKLLVIWDGIDGIKQTTKVGYVLNQFMYGKKVKIDILDSQKDIVESYILDEDYENYYLKNRLIEYNIESNNELKIVDDEEVDLIISEIDKINGEFIHMKGNSYKFSDKSKVFANGEQKGKNDVDVGLYALSYVDGPRILMIDLLEFDKISKKEGVLKEIDIDHKYFEIQIGDEINEYYFSDDMDFIFQDGYLENDDNNKSLAKSLKDKNVEGLKVSIYYDKENNKLKRMYIPTVTSGN